MGQMVAVGCGSGGSSDPDGGPAIDGGMDAGNSGELSCAQQSGTRIRHVVLESEEGARVYPGPLHDTAYDERCSFRLAADDSLRCIPNADGSPFAGGTLVFTDVNCTVEAAEMNAVVGNPAPQYMQTQTAAADCLGARYGHYVLGNPIAVTVGSTPIYRMVDGTCTAGTAISTSYFQVTSELAPDQFVAGTQSWVGGRIEVSQIDGEDGLRSCDILGSFRDTELDHPCQLQYGETGDMQCLPVSRALSPAFSDSGCTMATGYAAGALECDSGLQYTTEQANPAGCDLFTRARALIETDMVYTGSTEACTPVNTEEGQILYRRGPAVASGSFATFERDFVPIGARLARGDLVEEGGLRFHRFLFQDSTLSTLCAFDTASDGIERCLPADWPADVVQNLFSDAGCTAPTTVGLEQNGRVCFGTSPGYARLNTVDGTQVYEVTGAHPGPLFQMGASCTQITDLGSYYQLGAIVPPEQFVAADLIVE